MNFNKRYGLAIVACSLMVGCAGPGIHGEKKVTAASSSSAPSWVKDSGNTDQKQMIKNFDDSSDNPKYYYLVSQAHVDNDNLIPSCYNFARANSTNELASAVSQEVNGSVSSSSDSSSDSQYAVSTVQTKTALVGSQIMARYWEKTEDKDHSEQVTCYIVTAIPIKNFNQLKSIALKKASGSGEMDKKTREDAEKAHGSQE